MGDERVECAVIGAGVVGLAIARELALAGREVVVLEAEETMGAHTSSRNSEVIHAGFYYAKNSLKANFCVAGNRMLYAYCAERGVAHQRIGKLVVAVHSEEVATLDEYIQKGSANGVTDLRQLTRAEARALEPEVDCVAAVLSPSTGIIDSHGLMLALRADAESRGATIVCQSPVASGVVTKEGILLRTGGDQPMEISCGAVINSAGLFAQDVARSIEGISPASIPPRFFAKAHYFTLTGRAPFSRLVYPLATQSHLGVHVSLDLAGQVRFGPDISWVDSVDYRFDEGRAPHFYAAVRKFYPRLKDGQLQPGYTGIRPKVVGEGAAAADFVIQGPKDHGVPGLVNLYGIESPGLTACLAIGKYVRELILPMG
jgi:L-2-hydroxyglutarate oxidase LhgO